MIADSQNDDKHTNYVKKMCKSYHFPYEICEGFTDLRKDPTSRALK